MEIKDKKDVKPEDRSNGNREDIIKRKVNLAKERDTRVVFARTNDTHRVLDIIRAGDRGMKILRANLGIRWKPEEAVPLILEYGAAISKLNEITAKICSMTGVRYKAPRGLDKPAGAEEEAPAAGKNVSKDVK